MTDQLTEVRALCAAVYQIIGSHYFDAWREDTRWLPVMDLLGKAGNGERLECDPIAVLLPWAAHPTPELAAASAAGQRIRWQCGGCRSYFAGPHRETCPVCKRVGYWSGSFAGPEPAAPTPYQQKLAHELELLIQHDAPTLPAGAESPHMCVHHFDAHCPICAEAARGRDAAPDAPGGGERFEWTTDDANQLEMTSACIATGDDTSEDTYWAVEKLRAALREISRLDMAHRKAVDTGVEFGEQLAAAQAEVVRAHGIAGEFKRSSTAKEATIARLREERDTARAEAEKTERSRQALRERLGISESRRQTLEHKLKLAEAQVTSYAERAEADCAALREERNAARAECAELREERDAARRERDEGAEYALTCAEEMKRG